MKGAGCLGADHLPHIYVRYCPLFGDLSDIERSPVNTQASNGKDTTIKRWTRCACCLPQGVWIAGRSQ